MQLRAEASGPLRVPPRDEALYHRRSYDGYDGVPPYDGELEWHGLLRQLRAEGLEWCA